MPRCPRSSAALSACWWQERQSNCWKLLAGAGREERGKTFSCVVGSGMVFHAAEPLPPVPHAAARVSRANGRALKESRTAPPPSSTTSARHDLIGGSLHPVLLAENVSCGGDRSPPENCNRSPRRGRPLHL